MTIDEQIAALEEAIGSGVRRVVTQSNGVRTEIEYQSLDAMRSALADLKARRSLAPRIILAGF